MKFSLDIELLYMFILGVATAQYCLYRWRLGRGLAFAFQQFRADRNISDFFEIHQKTYTSALAWGIASIALVAFCAFRLAYMLNALNLESAFILGLILIFYAKDRIYYLTADFVMQRGNK